MTMTQQTVATYPAISQFVDDFTSVVDNNGEAYYEVLDLVTSKSADMSAISDQLQKGFEFQVSKALEVLRQSEEVEAVTVDLMQNLLMGWGATTFDRIARHYIDIDLETRLYDRFTSRLKTGE